MALTIKEYIVLYSIGDDLDFTEVNHKAAEGWELLEVEHSTLQAGQARFAYIMGRSAGQTETDVLVGTFTVTISDDRFAISNHGLQTGEMVRFSLGTEPTNVLPAPVVEGVYYYVVGSRINDFQVSPISGGSPVNITSTGVGATNEVWKK